jgi:hypothetical protein
MERSFQPRFRRFIRKLIEKHGRKGNLMKWREMLNGDCPKRDGRLTDRCDLVCPDLPKVIMSRTVQTETELECGRSITA